MVGSLTPFWLGMGLYAVLAGSVLALIVKGAELNWRDAAAVAALLILWPFVLYSLWRG